MTRALPILAVHLILWTLGTFTLYLVDATNPVLVPFTWFMIGSLTADLWPSKPYPS